MLHDLGQHRLKGLERPERLYRLEADGMTTVDLPLRSPRALGNLPSQRAPLVGREQELDELDRRLSGGSLVTVTGVGGVGKTRLALAAASAAGGRFTDGVWLIELGQVGLDNVASTVASTLGVRLYVDSETADAVAAALEGQQRLLVFDNCEHVLDPVADLTAVVQASCPDVGILATSREALGVGGELIIPIRPLSVNGGDRASAAVELFCERAAGVLGRFHPDEDELAIVGNITRLLDGLPLAIELAAARLPAMSLTELEERVPRWTRVSEPQARRRRAPPQLANRIRLVVRLALGVRADPVRSHLCVRERL